MNSDKLKNNLNERENLSADEQKICDLVGSLEKVSAPKDFDFRLKARIAAKETGNQTSVWRTLRYALPLTATLIIAAFMMIQAGLFSAPSNKSDDSIAAANLSQPQNLNRETERKNPEIAQTSNSFEAASNKTELAVSDEKSNIKNFSNTEKQKQLPVKLRSKSTPNEDSGGSRVLAQRPSNISILPEGFSANTAPANNDLNQNNSVPAREILDVIGVETEKNGNKLKVKAVKENSLAARSGIKTGDIIEAIDEQRLDDKNLSPKFNGGKTITVKRDDKILEIELKPN